MAVYRTVTANATLSDNTVQAEGTISDETARVTAVSQSVRTVASSDYGDLTNKPKINSHILEGDKSSADLGLAPADLVGDLKSVLQYNEIENSFDGLLANGYWNSNATLVLYNSDVCNTNKIPCKVGDKIHISTTPTISDAAQFISYINASGTTRVKRDTGTGTTYEGIAPEGAAYVCFTFEKSGLTKDSFDSVQVYVNSLPDKLNAINNSVVNVGNGIGKENTVFDSVSAESNIIPVYHCAKGTTPYSIRLKGIQNNVVRVFAASKNAMPICAVGEYSHNGLTVKAEPDGSLIFNGTTTGVTNINIPLVKPFTIINGMYEHYRNDVMPGYIELACRNASGLTVTSSTLTGNNKIFHITQSSATDKIVTHLNVYALANLTFNNNRIQPSFESDGLLKPYTPHSENFEAIINLNGVTVSTSNEIEIDQYGQIIHTASGTSQILGNVIPPMFSDDECFVYADDANITSITVDFFRSMVVKERNTECNMKADSASYYGIREGNVEKKKKFAALILTDVHGYELNVKNYVEYLNDMNGLDCGVNLGDTTPSYFDDGDGMWYTNIINKSLKPIYTAIGNHDILPSSLDASIGATAQAAYEKWIKPTAGVMGFDPEHPYYYAQYDKYKVALIVLNSYGTPNNTVVNGRYKTPRDVDAWTQEQADWFVTTLANIPTDYHLIIAMHDFPNSNGNVTVVECDWSEPGTYAIAPNNGNVNIGSAIEDTVNAWVNGTTLQRTYPVASYPSLWDASDFSPITINADFTSRGVGIFATYLIGHNHHDGINYINAYPTQHIAMFTTSSADGYQNYHGDLPRVLGTNTEDALSVVVVDTGTRTVRLVRIGSTFTTEMTEREYYKFDY